MKSKESKGKENVSSKKKKISLKNPRRIKARANQRKLFISFFLGIIIGAVSFFFNRDMLTSGIIAGVSFAFLFFYLYYRTKLSHAARVKKNGDCVS